jgi:hypothetical protein
MSRRFADRFPTVARLLSGSSLSTKPAADRGGDDEDEGERGARDRGTQIDAEDMQEAFEADAGKLVKAAVTDERKRWATVLGSDEGKANVAGARSLLDRTDMSADDAIATLKEMGPAAKPAPSRERERGGGADDEDGDERPQGRSQRRGRDRLNRSGDVDTPTGGAGGRERSGDGGDELEAARERRKEVRSQRNDRTRAAASGAGKRGAERASK